MTEEYINENELSDYEKVLIAMQSLASKSILPEGKEWNSITTNKCLLMILKRFGSSEDFISLSDDDEYNRLSKYILISDMLNVFSVDDILITLYYTFSIDKYKEITKDIPDNLLQSRYEEIVRKLNFLILEMMKKFNLHQSIRSMIPEQNVITGQDHARILWANKLTKMSTICRYAYMYDEEFTDYLVDYIQMSSKNIEDSEKRKDYLYNTYIIFDERKYLPHSKYFLKKNKELIRQMCKMSVSRTYSLESIYSKKGW